MLTIIMEQEIISAVQSIYIDKNLEGSPEMFMIRARPSGESYSNEEVIYASGNFFAVKTFYKRIADQVAAGVTVIDLRKMEKEEGQE